MADRPIIFSAPMVRALLREIAAPGTGKTQTRRTLKMKAARQTLNPRIEDPRYRVGDRLYVREHWRCPSKHDATAPRDLTPRSMTVAFEAGGSIANQDSRDDWRPSSASYTGADWMGRFRQAMHMPRWASRLTLIVTDVRVQRLHDCSEADAMAEGIEKIGDGEFLPHRLAGYWSRTALLAYGRLWDEINGPGAWAQNPWVAAYTFRPIHVNIDQIPT